MSLFACRGCKAKDAEIVFLRNFVQSLRTVHREPTSAPAVDLSLSPTPEEKSDPEPEPTPKHPMYSLYGETWVKPADEDKQNG